MSAGIPLVSARGLSMSFGAAQVLREVDFDLWPGEVHAITGENGAGKSSVAKIIAGIYRPVQGEILVRGQSVQIHGPQAANDLGIALVHQEPLSFPHLSVAENIFIGRQPKNSIGRVNWRRMNEDAQVLLDRLQSPLNPEQRVANLTVADRQMIEVAGALSRGAKVILFDETTASLTPKEVEELFLVIRRLRDEGCALGFVSHRMEEIFALCDRITVLRDGATVAEVKTSETVPNEIIKLMVGRDVSLSRPQTLAASGEILLKVSSLSIPNRVNGVSFEVRQGEIVVLAGLVGSGRTDVVQAIAGITPGTGEILLAGKLFNPKSPVESLAAGIYLVPEDRQHDGLLLPIAIRENVTLPILRRLFNGILRPKIEANIAQEWIAKLSIACRAGTQPVGELSGGNQQKVVLTKALLTKPRLLLIDEPTRGVDVGAKFQFHALLRELAAEGMAILMVSSDLPEVLQLADRILVMRSGKIVAEIPGESGTEEKVMLAAAGQEAIIA